MKSIFIILVFTVSSCSLFAQAHSGLITNAFDWSRWEESVSDSVKLETLEKIDYWLFTEYYQSHMQLEDDLSNFRFIDIDLDGHLEIFYEGFIGGEPTGTIIFKRGNNGAGEFEEYFIRMGTIESLWRNRVDGSLFMETVLSPCCMGTNYSKESWVHQNEEFELFQKINWKVGTIIPPKLRNPIKFKILNDPYTLRSAPEITDNNIITKFKTGDIGYALAEETDNTGRVWWFVYMINNNFTGDRALYDYAYDDNYYSVGWLSSRYVERIKE